MMATTDTFFATLRAGMADITPDNLIPLLLEANTSTTPVRVDVGCSVA